MHVDRLKLAVALLAILLTLAWLLGVPSGALTGGFWPARNALVYGTGILSVGFMAAAVILAARPVQIEGVLGGLDKFYRLHQGLGIGGGIGITPFIARLQALADGGGSGPVDLIYSTAAPAQDFIANIRRLAERAGVRFHLLVSARDGLPTLDRLERMIPEWKEADLWFCGPLGFGDALRDAVVARGFPAQRFHREMFDMR